MATSKQRPAVNNDWSDPQSANIFHDHPLDNGHFRTTASFFESQGWPLYTGLTVYLLLKIYFITYTIIKYIVFSRNYI
jgi:hypothetical protein